MVPRRKVSSRSSPIEVVSSFHGRLPGEILMLPQLEIFDVNFWKVKSPVHDFYKNRFVTWLSEAERNTQLACREGGYGNCSEARISWIGSTGCVPVALNTRGSDG